MHVMAPRETWTDERLDDFRAETRSEFTAVRAEMREGFARIEKRFDEVDQRFEKIDERFEKIDQRFEKSDERFQGIGAEFVAVRREMKEGFESQTRMMVYGIVATCASIVAGFGAVAGIVAAAI